MAHYDLALIGTGSGNTILDERYRDKSIAICEQGVFGGTCLNVGCIPTKMFVYAAENARDSSRFGVDARVEGVRWPEIVSRIFGRMDPLSIGGANYRRASPNVTVYDQHTRFGPVTVDGRDTLRVDGGEEFTASQVVIAAGSRAVVPPAIAESGIDYHTSDTIMRIAELPEHLLIVGGGYVAAEFAHIFSSLGSHVTLLIRGSAMLTGHDDTITERFSDIAAKNGRSTTTQRWSVAAESPTASSCDSRTGRRCAVTRCWWPPGGCPTGIGSTPSRPASRCAATDGSSSASTSAPPPAGFSRSAT